MYLLIDNYIFKRNLVETTLLPDGAYSMQISNYDEGEENKDLIKFIFHSPINPEATSNFYSHALFYVVSLKRTSKNMYILPIDIRQKGKTVFMLSYVLEKNILVALLF